MWMPGISGSEDDARTRWVTRIWRQGKLTLARPMLFVLRAVLIVLSIVLVAATLVPLISTLSGTGPPSLGRATPVGNALFASPTPVDCFDSKGPSRVLFIVRRFDRQASTLTMNVLLCMPRDLVLQVRGTRTPQRATFVQPSGSGLPGQV